MHHSSPTLVKFSWRDELSSLWTFPQRRRTENWSYFSSSGAVEKIIFDFDLKESQKENTGDEEEYESTGEAADEKPKQRTRKLWNKLMSPTLTPLSATPWRKLRKTASSAYVIFLDSPSIERALASTSTPRIWPTSSEEPSVLVIIMLFTVLYALH